MFSCPKGCKFFKNHTETRHSIIDVLTVMFGRSAKWHRLNSLRVCYE